MDTSGGPTARAAAPARVRSSDGENRPPHEETTASTVYTSVLLRFRRALLSIVSRVTVKNEKSGIGNFTTMAGEVVR